MELTIGFLLFTTGYLVGRLNLLQKTMRQAGIDADRQATNKQNTWNSSNTQSNTLSEQALKISIDESKFVTNVKTDSFQKDFDDLGNKTVSEDNINTSVSKLSQLKKK